MFFFGNGAVNRRNRATAANFLRKIKKIVVARMDARLSNRNPIALRLRLAVQPLRY